MEFLVNCNTGTLAPYSVPLDESKAAHLYRRLGFSASVQTVQSAIGQNASALIDNLVNEALAAPNLPAPTWADWNRANYPEDDDEMRALKNTQYKEWKLAYTNSLLDNNLKERLSFFWSNHLVTELQVYECSSFLYYYVNCLQRNAIGNFKTFISEIGLTSAMLFYLDGAYNNRFQPNENYGRELYELFTLGEGQGYTEQDVIETARALTGYVERGEISCSPVAFNPAKHDADDKTILGQTGNWDYEDVIDILFQQRGTEIATFICRKLYEFFVHPDSKGDTGGSNVQAIIEGMASTFVTNNFEIAPVLRQLFTSEHFFSDDAIGVIIKSPFDLYLNLLKEGNFTYTDETLDSIINSCKLLSQDLFNPVDVAGWQRDRSWINTNFMIGRWLTIKSFITDLWEANPEEFRTFGIEATGDTGATTNDPDEVARAIIHKLTPKGFIEELYYTTAYTVFREQYESDTVYMDGSWNMNLDRAGQQVYDLLVHLATEPELQLK